MRAVELRWDCKQGHATGIQSLFVNKLPQLLGRGTHQTLPLVSLGRRALG